MTTLRNKLKLAATTAARITATALCATLAITMASQHATAQTKQQTKQQKQKHSFQTADGSFLLDGKPFIVKAAELHYPRIPKEYWEHRIQMCKALGMNTICLYVFWNLHEPSPDNFDFSGNADVRLFCQLAQKNDMWVILRPGPYVCAEWEMGGLPWWLLKHKGITLRDDEEPYFLNRVAIFEKQVANQLADLTIDKGGPIIMVQVENEYGSYAEDKSYVAKVRDTLRQAGFDTVTLFQCDWASNFTKNGLDDLVWTMNFGTGADITKQFQKLRQLRPTAPLMCSEFWSGWFDKWGAKHETRPADKMVSGITQMIQQGISFSLYMTHGGTSFGHWAGANSPGFAPDVTSYDYDAPINEQGAPTQKYHLLRETLAKFSENPLPDIPKNIPLTTIDTIAQWTFTPLDKNAATTTTSDSPLPFEDLDLGWGYAIYKGPNFKPQAKWAELEFDALHDYAIVSLDNGAWTQTVNRTINQQSIRIPDNMLGQQHSIEILVEAMGRINFGRAIEDHKGITNAVRLVTPGDKPQQLNGWTITTIPDDYASIAKACKAYQQKTNMGQVNKRQGLNKAGHYRATFKVDKPADTFLNLSLWGKGQAYVNGHPLGRYWSIGPQQTLYLPGAWLKKGKNEIIITDIKGPRQLKAWGQTTPELNLLQPDTENRPPRPARPDLGLYTPIASGTLPNDAPAATIALHTPAQASSIALEILTTHGAKQTAIAEIIALDKDGKQISRDNWEATYASSDDTQSGNNTPSKAFDLQESTFWQSAPKAKAPHLIVIDLGQTTTISKLLIFTKEGQDKTTAPAQYRLLAK